MRGVWVAKEGGYVRIQCTGIATAVWDQSRIVTCCPCAFLANVFLVFFWLLFKTLCRILPRVKRSPRRRRRPRIRTPRCPTTPTPRWRQQRRTCQMLMQARSQHQQRRSRIKLAKSLQYRKQRRSRMKLYRKQGTVSLISKVYYYILLRRRMIPQEAEREG